jgi:uncharacterized repeat protein (TIGR01451 family)
MPNAPRTASRTRLLIAFVATLFAVSVFLHQMYFAPRVQALSSTIVISQLYGGGGNSGATLTNDFIELFNRGTTPVSLAGWSVQYASSAGTSWQRTDLTAVTLQPGQYYLVQEAQGAGGTTSLPTPDATGTIAMSATAGKVALVNNQTTITSGISCPTGASIIDFVGFGSAANCFEGAGPTATLTNTTAALRGVDGCTENDNNSTDFAAGAPNPRNTATPLDPCTGPPALAINDVSVVEGDSLTTTATFTVSLSGPAPVGGVTFDIATADDAAQDGNPGGEDNDYVAKAETGRTITAGNTSATFTVTVNGDINFESNETFLVNVTNVSGATIADGQGVGTILNDDCPVPAADIVISQVYGGGGNTGATFTRDFIELFNQGATTVNLSGWSVQYASANGTSWQVTPLTGSIAPGGYYLIQEAAGAGGTTPLPTPDNAGTIAMSATAGKVALSSSTVAFSGSCPTCPIDLVGYGGANCFEGSGPTAPPSNTTAALRKRGGCFDSDDNAADFSISSPNPRNSSNSRTCDYTPAAIHDIQGNGLTTPFLGQDVSTNGIVTGIKTNGFFIQEPDAGVDADPNTSEGIFVFTSAAPAVAVGDAVTVLGTATEFFNLTQLDSTLPGDVTVNSNANPLPTSVTLTTTILDPAGTLTQLERFEGMRMHADALVSVVPSNEFGETFTVLDGVARPMREPGIEISLPVPPDPTSGVVDCCIPRWDENPERIMIDSDGLAGSSPISVTSNVTFSNVTGPLDFTFGDYKVLPATPPGTTDNMSAVPVATPAVGEFTIAGYNIENFNNNATQRQKAALAIRDVLHLPDIIGTIEIFDLADLEALAAEIQSISGVTYEAHLIEADGASEDADQDVGFLVNTSRVQVDSVTQEELAGCVGTAATCNTFTDPNTNQQALLNDRPPLTLRATVDPSGTNPVPVIVVVNHLRSFIDIEGLNAEGARVRAKRKAQGEFLADLLQGLQTDNAGTPIMSIGDYNAYQFSDGYTDPVATIKGTPTSDDEVVVDESPDLVSPDFVNLTDGLPANQRYSFIFEGTPQALDHMIVNNVAHGMLQRYAIARNNSDFPEVPGSAFLTNAARPERNSDHDMPVAYFRPLADLSITKAASPEPVVTGSDVTYTITLTNNGPNAAQSVTVSDNLPTQTTLVSCNATGGGVCGGTGNNRTVTFSSLASGASATITLVATVNCAVADGFVISNTASASSDTNDPDTGNNSQTAMATASNPPPTITLTTQPITLSPPNHTYRTISVSDMVASASDNCDPNVNVGAVVITQVTSDEPENAPGNDGNTLNDIVIALDCKSVQLRSERAGNLNGRVYTITLKLTDSSGNVTTATYKVTVPLSPGAGAAVDSAPVYTVTSACP